MDGGDAAHPAASRTTSVVPVTAAGQPLAGLELPRAPAVVRSAGKPFRRPRAPALALLGLGLLLTLAPIVGGMFSKVAAGRQMIDRFSPHMEADALARYGSDVGTLRRGAAGIDSVYRSRGVPAGAFPGLDVYRRQSRAIDARAQGLLDRVAAAEPDYRRVAGIGGFDRIPFLIVVSGIVAIYGGFVLLTGGRNRARAGAALVVLASGALAAYPFLSGLDRGAVAGQRMLRAFAPLMTHTEVSRLQSDFVVLVTAVGEMDTSFRPITRTGPGTADIAAVVDGWPGISSDLASLVGVVNDDIGNFRALQSLDAMPRRVGLPGLDAFPWILVGIGAGCAGLAVAARPRPRKETR